MAAQKLFGITLGSATRAPFQKTSLSYLRTRNLRLASTVGDIKPDQASEIEGVDLDPFAPVQGGRELFLSELNIPLKRSFNLASYVNSCETLKELVKIGVSLYDIEHLKPRAAQQLVQLDFQRDCVKYLKFLVDSGLKTSNLGRFISEFPEIFQVPILELQTRLEYLRSKNFSSKQIASALNRSSYILSMKVKTLDHKLGELQIELALPAPTIRIMLSKHPLVVAHPVNQYRLINICLSDEFGFSQGQMHTIFAQQPKVIDLLRPRLIERLDLVHNSMGLSHAMITKFPKLITGPQIDIKNRFSYLRKLKRDQFDPKLPLYVQPSALYNLSDEEFCKRYAKTTIDDYKLFIKTCL